MGKPELEKLIQCKVLNILRILKKEELYQELCNKYLIFLDN